MVFGAVIFVVWPELDLMVADRFFVDGRFLGDTVFWRGLTKVMQQGEIVMLLALVVLAILAICSRRKPVSIRRWWAALTLLCAVTLVVGPWLLVNEVLKSHVGRARPAQIEAFGRDRSFSPAFVVSDQCQTNCSFVSGDVAIAVWLFCAVGWAFRRGRRYWLVAAMVGGAMVGLLRMLVGAHFLSDVLFAILFTLFCNALCWHMAWRMRRHVRRGAVFMVWPR